MELGSGSVWVMGVRTMGLDIALRYFYESVSLVGSSVQGIYAS